jgi:hypothetical protein
VSHKDKYIPIGYPGIQQDIDSKYRGGVPKHKKNSGEKDKNSGKNYGGKKIKNSGKTKPK